MKLETFFEKFELFAEAPNAVAKIRELVMWSAFSGAFASEKRDQPVPEDWCTEGAPVLPAIPSSWKWRQGSEIFQVIRGVSYKKNDARESPSEGLLPLLRANNIGNGVSFDDLVYVPRAYVRDDQLIQSGDIVIAMSSGSKKLVGKAASVTTEFSGSFGAFCGVIRNKSELQDEVLSRYFRSPQYTSWVTAAGRGIGINNLSKGDLDRMPIPVPPIAEQKRIVAKVDELMALCDRLEAQQQERETRHAALSRAALARFAEAPTPANLQLVFQPTYPTAPADLRRAIRALAVRGELVTQDPNDEPAVSVLASTTSLFERLFSEGTISKPKPLATLEENELPFALPSGWVHCRLGQLIRVSSGDGLIASAMKDGSIPVYGGNGVTGHHDASNIFKQTLVIGRVGFYCGSIHVTPEKAWVTDNAFVTVFDEDNVSIDFLSVLLKATDLRARDNATAQPVISGSKIYPIAIALPPLAEQRRIVAKVDELMALCDRLELQLSAAKAKASKLLDAAIHQLLHPRPKDARAAIACYALVRIAQTPNFGRTKLAKIDYTALAHLAVAANADVYRDIAGPFDRWIYAFESEGQRQGWFELVEQIRPDGSTKVQYLPKAALAAKAAEAIPVLGRHKAEFDRVLDLFASLSTTEVEIVATLFAAWNDLLLDGEQPHDEAVIREVRENWHPSKQRFTPAQLGEWLDWMRRHALVPQGRGPRTKQQLTLNLH